MYKMVKLVVQIVIIIVYILKKKFCIPKITKISK